MINTEHGWRGGENQLALLVCGLPSPWPTYTVCQPGSPLVTTLRGAHQHVEEITMRGPMDIIAAWRIRCLIKRLKACAVHAHTSHGHTLALLATTGLNVPVLVTRRVDFPLKRGWLSRWKYGPRVQRFIAVSSAVGHILSRGGIETTRVSVIRDGVNPTRIAEVQTGHFKQEFNIPAHAVLVGCIAHLTDHKDHRTLLDAWAQVERRSPDAWLAIIGTGELEATLKSHAATLGLQHIVFTGFRRDIPAILHSLDIFTLSSHLEGLGSSVMDAMLAGVPVVATRAGGIPELVTHERTGLLVPIRDPSALADALCRVIVDRDLRQRLGIAGRYAAEPAFTAQRMVDEHVALYQELMP